MGRSDSRSVNSRDPAGDSKKEKWVYQGRHGAKDCLPNVVSSITVTVFTVTANTVIRLKPSSRNTMLKSEVNAALSLGS